MTIRNGVMNLPPPPMSFRHSLPESSDPATSEDHAASHQTRKPRVYGTLPRARAEARRLFSHRVTIRAWGNEPATIPNVIPAFIPGIQRSRHKREPAQDLQSSPSISA